MHLYKGTRIFARNDAGDDLWHFLWIKGSPPGIETIGALHSSTAAYILQKTGACPGNFVRIVDFAAACASQIAAEKRFEHEDQGVFFGPVQFLFH